MLRTPRTRAGLLRLGLNPRALSGLAEDLGIVAGGYEVRLRRVHQALAGAIDHAGRAWRSIEDMLCGRLLAVGCGDRHRANRMRISMNFGSLLLACNMSRARTMPNPTRREES